MPHKSCRILTLLTAVCIPLSCSVVLAQPTPAHTPPPSASAPTSSSSFEVATVKPIDPALRFHLHAIKISPGGLVNLTTFSVRDLIRIAFNIEDWQVSGLDRWMWMEGFDIQARPAETTPPTTYNLRHTNEHIIDEHLRLMLQALLIDRFQFKFHITTATGPVFLLEKSGKPIRLVPTPEPSEQSKRDLTFGGVSLVSDHSWYMGNTSMPQFASFASREFLHRPVIDRTGLEGSFDFRWEIISASSDPEQSKEEDTFPLFLQAMGLKLTKSTGPVETFVIEHVERPTSN